VRIDILRPLGASEDPLEVRVPADLKDQIGDDGQVEDKQYYLTCREAPNDFVYLQGNERGRGDDREVLCPALSKHQAGAFGQQKSGIEKGTEAQRFEFLVVQIGELGKRLVDVKIVGIDTDQVGPTFDLDGYVLVQQLQGSNAQSKQCEPFEKLERRDEPENARLRCSTRSHSGLIITDCEAGNGSKGFPVRDRYGMGRGAATRLQWGFD
jgi:hypothetical protein